jgi:hypothetical protein
MVKKVRVNPRSGVVHLGRCSALLNYDMPPGTMGLVERPASVITPKTHVCGLCKLQHSLPPV